MPFTNKIEKLMHKKRIKTVDRSLYDFIGTNQRQFGQFKRNEKQPDLEQAWKIAQWLECTISDLCSNPMFP